MVVTNKASALRMVLCRTHEQKVIELWDKDEYFNIVNNELWKGRTP